MAINYLINQILVDRVSQNKNKIYSDAVANLSMQDLAFKVVSELIEHALNTIWIFMTGGCRVFLVYRPQMGFSQTKNGTRSISSSTQTSSKIVVFMLQTFFCLEIGPSSSNQTNRYCKSC